MERLPVARDAGGVVFRLGEVITGRIDCLGLYGFYGIREPGEKR